MIGENKLRCHVIWQSNKDKYVKGYWWKWMLVNMHEIVCWYDHQHTEMFWPYTSPIYIQISVFINFKFHRHTEQILRQYIFSHRHISPTYFTVFTVPKSLLYRSLYSTESTAEIRVHRLLWASLLPAGWCLLILQIMNELKYLLYFWFA